HCQTPIYLAWWRRLVPALSKQSAGTCIASGLTHRLYALRWRCGLKPSNLDGPAPKRLTRLRFRRQDIEERLPVPAQQVLGHECARHRREHDHPVAGLHLGEIEERP